MPSPIRVTFNSKAIDPILNEPQPHHLELVNDLSDRGLIEIVTTHVQAAELAAILRISPSAAKACSTSTPG